MSDKVRHTHSVLFGYSIYERCEQDDTLSGDTSSVDVSSQENLLKLAEVGKNLLKKLVSRVNLETGVFEAVNGEGTNEEELTRFARLLSEERKLRHSKM